MIDRDGNARIMDFGIVRSLGEKGITGAGALAKKRAKTILLKESESRLDPIFNRILTMVHLRE
jgi:hypothetical protein